MGISERIKLIRADEAQGSFALKVGAHQNTIGRWERGERIPDQINLCKILDVYPDINPGWLLTGEGPMYRGDKQRVVIQATGAANGTALDQERLQLAIETLEEALQTTRKTMPPARKAELVLAIYDYFDDPDEVQDKGKLLKFIKTAI